MTQFTQCIYSENFRLCSSFVPFRPKIGTLCDATMRDNFSNKSGRLHPEVCHQHTLCYLRSGGPTFKATYLKFHMFRKTSCVELYSDCFTSCTIFLELVTYVNIKYDGNSFTRTLDADMLWYLPRKGRVNLTPGLPTCLCLDRYRSLFSSVPKLLNCFFVS